MNASEARTAEGAVDAGKLVCLGVIAGAHGITGALRVKLFSEDPKALEAYGPLTDEHGEGSFELRVTSRLKGFVLARIEGIEDRDAAERLKGVRLCVARERLPEPEQNEYYHSDLIGLSVERADGEPFGTVRAVHDFGGGDLLEIEQPGSAETVLLPFTKAFVPVVELKEGRLVVEPPEETD